MPTLSVDTPPSVVIALFQVLPPTISGRTSQHIPAPSPGRHFRRKNICHRVSSQIVLPRPNSFFLQSPLPSEALQNHVSCVCKYNFCLKAKEKHHHHHNGQRHKNSSPLMLPQESRTLLCTLPVSSPFPLDKICRGHNYRDAQPFAFSLSSQKCPLKKAILEEDGRNTSQPSKRSSQCLSLTHPIYLPLLHLPFPLLSLLDFCPICNTCMKQVSIKIYHHHHHHHNILRLKTCTRHTHDSLSDHHFGTW